MTPRGIESESLKGTHFNIPTQPLGQRLMDFIIFKLIGYDSKMPKINMIISKWQNVIFWIIIFLTRFFY